MKDTLIRIGKFSKLILKKKETDDHLTGEKYESALKEIDRLTKHNNLHIEEVKRLNEEIENLKEYAIKRQQEVSEATEIIQREIENLKIDSLSTANELDEAYQYIKTLETKIKDMNIEIDEANDRILGMRNK